MKTLREFVEKNILTVLIVIAVITGSGILGTAFYKSYKNSLIEQQQKMMLTMARTVGNNLASYIDSQLNRIDLYFSALNSDREAGFDPEEIIGKIMISDTSLFDGALCFERGGNPVYSSGSIYFDADAADLNDVYTLKSYICGKKYTELGRYQLYVAKDFTADKKEYTFVFALNLSQIHSSIVDKVRIGTGGYSVVKDEDLNIIMHPSSSQIGMGAIDDRLVKYPNLDLSSLTNWIDLQKREPEGVGLIDSYKWDEASPSPQSRIIAYTTIYLRGDTWIVNSNYPYEELYEPLNKMFFRILFSFILISLIIVSLVVSFEKNRIKSVTQKNEIKYLKQINDGMELLIKKEEEIQHYQRVQSIGQMSSHIAHEFNNYLTPIMVYGEILESDPAMSEDNLEMVKGILDVSKQAAGLSRKLLDFSRQDTEIALKSINFTKEIKAASKILETLTPQAVRCTIDLCEEQLYINGRDGMAEHFLMNLGNNAFHAMENNKDREKQLFVHLYKSVTQDSESAVLEVADTGCGIVKDAMDKLFEPFYTTKKSGKGTGLGLSVVKSLVISCGGNIEVFSEVDKGTTFRLTFPLVKEFDITGNPSQEKIITKIAVVDDDPVMLKTLKLLLEKNGFSCKTYDHPAAVLSLIQNEKLKADLIITDYSMPTMNGLEFAEIVRKLDSEIGIILMSGMTDVRFDWYLKNHFVDEFILKSEIAEKLIPILKI